MRKSSVVLVLALALMALPVAAFAQEGEMMPGPTGTELLDYVLNVSPYTGWSYAVGEDGSAFLASQSPHGPVVRVFLNDVAAAALGGMMMGEMSAEMEAALPYGSIIVKEAYQAEGATPENPGDVTSLTVMYKVEGFDPDNSDWFWLAAAPDGSAINAEGAVEMCITCHAQEGNYDYTLLGYENFAVVMMPGIPAEGAALLEYVLETNPYTEWAYAETPDESEFLASQSPHGPVVRVFLNDVAAMALSGVGEMRGEVMGAALPYGSIIVKEAYQAEGATPENPGDVTALVVMYKVEGFDPANNDWFWLAAAPDGSAISAEGAVEMCIACHSAEGNYDYTLLGYGNFIIEMPHAMMIPDVPAEGAALLDYIFNVSPYTEWPLFDPMTEFMASESPHGPVVRVFMNQIVAAALGHYMMDEGGEMIGEFALPYGSIIVKEAYQTEGATPENPGDLSAVTVMYKVEGFDPVNGDWFWAVFAPDGGAVNVEGAVEMCIQCHGQEGNVDYTLLPMLYMQMMEGQ